MIFTSLPTGPLDVNCYIVGSKSTGHAAVFDPGGHVDKILSRLDDYHLKAKWIINTHGHFDHIGGNRALVEQTGAELMIHEADLPLLGVAEQHAANFGLTTELHRNRAEFCRTGIFSTSTIWNFRSFILLAILLEGSVFCSPIV